MENNLFCEIPVRKPYIIAIEQGGDKEYLILKKSDYNILMKQHKHINYYTKLNKQLENYDFESKKEYTEYIKECARNEQEEKAFEFYINQPDKYERIKNEITPLINIVIMSDVFREGEKVFEKCKKYNPFEIEDLYLKLINLNIFDYNSIIKFHNTYGLINDQLAEHTYRLTGKLNCGIGIKQNLFIVNKCLKELYICFEIYKSLQEDNIILVRKDKDIIFRVHNITQYINKELDLSELSDRQILKIAFANITNSYLSKININLSLDKCYNFMPGDSAVSTISIAFYQLYKLAINEVKLKKCNYCGSPFHPKVHNQKYCPPPDHDPAEKSRCKNRYESMKNYWKQKIVSGEISIEEAAKKITWKDKNEVKHFGRPIEEIKSWIK